MANGRRDSRRRVACSWRRAVAVTAAGVLALGRRGADADVCVLSSGKKEVTIGKETSVCLVVNGLGWEVDADQTFYSQVLILPDADEFSRFSVKGSWNASRVIEDDPILTTFGTEVGVHVESMGKYSFQKAFRLRQEEKTFPLHTAIISVEEGEVTGISWDDGCHFCGSSQCEDNTYDYTGQLIGGEGNGQDCYWPDSDCLEDGVENQVSALCQLTVYVVWTGTDSKGNFFTSFAKRLSMYAGETVEGLISDAGDTYEDTIVPAVG
ncbi:unnamed protein product [Ectocarpus sp. CCAP 1310/34]|nr:unnamed protein product [Ectocarpus sp. CCAP 1310/34]